MAEPDEDDGVGLREKLEGVPRALRFPDRRAAATWLDTRLPALSAATSLAVADGELDTLARRLIAALVRALAEHRGTAEAAPSCTGCTGWSWTWPSGAACTGSRPPHC